MILSKRDQAAKCRHIAQYKIDLHPVSGEEHRAALKREFRLTEDELDSMHELLMWVCNHGLEVAWNVYREY